MNSSIILPTYTEVKSVLKKPSEIFHPSEVHGVLCGILCGSSNKNNKSWETLPFVNSKDKKNYTVIQQLYEKSYDQLNEFSFEFALLLPKDNLNINKRAEALGLWCQGFITGLDHERVEIKHREPSEVTEAINDLIEISKVNYGEITENEEDETAYFELVEYVRLAVLMIFQELKQKSSNGTNSKLH